MKASLNSFLIVVIGFSLAACDRGQQSSPGSSSVAVKTKALPATIDRLTWNRNTLVEAYKTSGKGNPAWDAEAEKALAAFARVRASDEKPADEDFESLRVSLRATRSAGCDDPLIRYLQARFIPNEADSELQSAEKASAIASELNLSTYPPIRRFYACLRAAEASVVTIGEDHRVPPGLVALRYSATTNLLVALADMTTPPEEIHEAVGQWLSTSTRSARQLPEDMRFVEPALGRWPETAVILITKAECATAMAWNARGNGFADSVTPEGLRLFEQRLGKARDLLEKAWAADPGEARAATRMIPIVMGLGLSRSEMEKWFGRAMKSNTNNFEACEAKLFYLKPQWFGSEEDMLQFGRECVASSSWGGRVPLILLDAHGAVAQRQSAEEKQGYWKRPAVWKDVQSSFDKFFTLNPEAEDYHHNYAWYAFQAEQWKSFNQQLLLFGRTTNYAYFGGKERFEAMVAQAAGKSAP